MSGSFKAPPFDGTLILPQLIEYNAQHSPNHTLFAYASPHGEILTITWSAAAVAARRAARLVLKLGSHGQRRSPLIGILANLDSITYHTLYLGIMRAGGIALLISTRNSPNAVAHLLKKTKTHTLFVSTDEPIQNLASLALSEVREDGHKVDLFTVPTFHDLYTEGPDDEDIDSMPDCTEDLMNSTAVILHSSGSTSFPKPIFQSHRQVLQWGRLTNLYVVDESAHRLAAHALPVFHAFGFCLIPWATRSGLSIGLFPPRERPVVPSPQNLLEAAMASKCSVLLVVPLFVEVWSRSEEDINNMKRFGIIFAGGPLNKLIGDELYQKGVRLQGFYGSTEVGPGSSIGLVQPGNHGWDWFSLVRQSDVKFLPQEGDPNVFELAYVEAPGHRLTITNMEIDGKAAYATSDLVTRHPKDPRKFKIFGRKDDQIILSTGEKTNPGPLEVIICRDPLVQFAVMFGRGKDRNGILIKPIPGHEIDPTDTIALAQFRNALWHSVEKANKFAPSHSRLYKEMILVANPSKPFEMTAKLAPRRHAVVEAYKDEIEGAYNAVRAAGVSPPATWTPDEVRNFVRKTVYKVMEKEVGDEDDIFQHGGDSLQATYIRNMIIYAAQESRKEIGYISQGFVYANPSITGLSNKLLAIAKAGSGLDSSDVSSKLKEMADLVEEFTTAFPGHRPSRAGVPQSGEVVLLTGTTGGLGAQLLSYLVSLPYVSRVYALNRRDIKGCQSLRDRQAAALSERGLDVDLLDSPKVALVECDIETEGFGIGSALYSEICNTTTLIIHNAWRVNFNMALATFKPMLHGVRNLVDMALQSPLEAPPRIIYTSSVGVYRGWRGPGRPPEAAIEDPTFVVGSGYSESKFIGERILEAAAKSTPLRPVIVRIGQLTSNSSGAWNSSDWLPAIVRSGQVLGVLPFRDDCIAWLSLDIAARAVVDFRTSKSQYVHLMHPNPVPWNTVFDVFSSVLNVPLIGWTEWLSQLEKNGGAAENNPAVHLLDYFRGCSPIKLDGREALGTPLLDLKEALEASSSLADPSIPQTNREDAERWVRHWRRNGFLSGIATL